MQANFGTGATLSSAHRLSLAERKTWALRQGDPLWLWPEVAIADWQFALTQIEFACGSVLRGQCAFTLHGDASAIELAGYTSGMGPMLGWWLEKGIISAANPIIDQACRRQLRANRVRMKGLLARAREVAARLTGSGIEVTVLKGAHTSSVYFPCPGCRPMSDIDILIRPDDVDRAGQILEIMGYRRAAKGPLESTWAHAESAACPQTMLSLEADDPWTVDLHVSLDVLGPPGAVPARLSDRKGNTEAWQELPAANQLSRPLLLLHLAAHAGAGFHNLTLMRLLEIVLVARDDTSADRAFWDELLELGESTRSLAFAYPALALARQLSPGEIPETVVNRGARAAPTRVRRLVEAMRPATAHRIAQPTISEHFAWTQGPGGWLRRLAADVAPAPGSWRETAGIQLARARSLLRYSTATLKWP